MTHDPTRDLDPTDDRPRAAEAADEPKRLRRSRSDKALAGVCGGLGDYFNIDPIWFRVLFLITAIAGGPGILAYIVLWLVMPEEPR